MSWAYAAVDASQSENLTLFRCTTEKNDLKIILKGLKYSKF